MLKKKAFTMAEILIVMFLIGFLFTLMIPNVMQKQSSTKFIENAQLAQNTLQEAFSKAAAANDDLYPQDWESVRYSHNKAEAIVKEIAKKTSVMSFCGSSPEGCFASDEYRTLNGAPTNILTEKMKSSIKKRDSQDYIVSKKIYNEDTEEYRLKKLEYTFADPQYATTYFTLLNGGAVALKTNSTYCEDIITSTDPLDRPLCGEIIVDVNGAAIPNSLGVDVFGFYLSGNDIIPMGFYGDDFEFNYNCLREKPDAKSNNGLACSAWALKNKNMEYRKCQAGIRLSWTDSKRCEDPPTNK